MFREPLRQAIPSMFHRRLLLLAVLGGLTVAGLGLRAIVMTTGPMHSQRQQQAESSLVSRRFAPTKRGRIFDRNGVILAEDKPGWNVTIHYSVISGAWVKKAAHAAARSDPAWGQSTDDEREELSKKWRAIYVGRLAEFWQRLARTAHINPQVLFDRQEAVIKRISVMRDRQLLLKWNQLIRENNDNGERVAMGDDGWNRLCASFTMPEEVSYHAVLDDVDDSTRLAVQEILDTPEYDDGMASASGSVLQPLSIGQKLGILPKSKDSVLLKQYVRDTPWRLVDLQLVRARRYPCETLQLDYDCSSLPPHKWVAGEEGKPQLDYNLSSLAPAIKHAQSLPLLVRGIGMHIVGYTRKASDSVALGQDGKRIPGALSELERHPFNRKLADETTETDLHGLMPGDYIGAKGIEKSFEESLRGTRGEVRIRRTQSSAAGEDRRVEPVAGHDVQLSLDIQLQARVEAAMSPEVGLTRIEPFHPRTDVNYYDDLAKTKGRLNGAALVLDAQTGEVLAAASAPGIALDDLQNQIGALWADKINAPMLNRVGSPFQPGSVVKPLVLAAAMTEGVYHEGEIVDIPGYPFIKEPGRWRDFYYNHYHKPLGPHELDYAIAVSSSPPFVMLAQTREDRSGKLRLGPKRWFDWADRFGLGHSPHAGLPAFEDQAGKVGEKGKPPVEMDAVTAMGQGNITATPLQIATAYGRLLAGHMGFSSTYLKRLPDWVAVPPAGEPRLAPETTAYVLRGMQKATRIEGGTFAATFGGAPAVFNCPGVTVWAKSGTAQVSVQWIDFNGNKKYDGREELIRAGDHAWTVALCAPEGEAKPRFIIVTMLEYGGSGGRAAGPIANQVIHALKAEGYLGKTPKVLSAPAVVNPATEKGIDDATAVDPDQSAVTAPEPAPIKPADGSESGGVL